MNNTFHYIYIEVFTGILDRAYYFFRGLLGLNRNLVLFKSKY